MKKVNLTLRLLVFVLLITLTSNAQVSITATVGTPGPTSYTTLKAAFDAVNAGTHKGNILISVTGDCAEINSAVLNASGTGSSSYSGILIRPTVTAIIHGDVTGALVDLNGADNVVIDGRIGSTGTIRSLTVVNYSTAADQYTSTIRMRNDAMNNTLTYLNLQGSATSTLTGSGLNGTVLIDRDITGSGNANITISNNDIGPTVSNLPNIAVYVAGYSSSKLNTTITISNNLIHDYFGSNTNSMGVQGWYTSGMIISGNSFYQTVARTSTASNMTNSAVELYASKGSSVSNNMIGGSAAGATGTPYTLNGPVSRFSGILIQSDTAANSVSNIDGNIITNINSTISSNPQAFSGIIVVDCANVNIGVTAGNTIGAGTGTGSITCTVDGNSAGNIYGIYVDNVNSDIRNNIIGSITLTGSSTASTQLKLIQTDNQMFGRINIQDNVLGGSTASSLQSNLPNTIMRGILMFGRDGDTVIAQNNIIRNMENNGSINSVILGMQHQSFAPNIASTVLIRNNQIYNLNSQGATALDGHIYGVFITQFTTTNSYLTNCIINNNLIHNLNSNCISDTSSVRGIFNNGIYKLYLNIDSNTIHHLSSAVISSLSGTTGAQGIYSPITGAGSFSAQKNSIYDLELTSASSSGIVCGISLRYGNSGAAQLHQNKIYNLKTASAAAVVSGISLKGVSGAGNFSVVNNMVSASPGNCQVYGIRLGDTAATVSAYHNSIYIGGTSNSAYNSGAFFRENNPTGADIRNNIFYNFRTGGTGNHFALLNSSANPTIGWTSGNNNLFSTNTATAALWGTGNLGLATYKTTAADATSKAVSVSFVNAAGGDLHLSGVSVNDANLDGTPVGGITTDFDDETRSATNPKIGADEALICTSPAIVTQPTSQSACIGSTVSLSVGYTGSNTSFQWRKGGNNITGATGPTYTIAGLTAVDAGSYDILITNSCGSVTSNAVPVTINNATLITLQPAGVLNCNASSVTFNVSATGTNLSYQWKLNGNNVTSGAGGTTANYTLPVTSATQGVYTVLVSGTCGTQLSNVASLTIQSCTAIPNVDVEINSVVMTPNLVRDVAIVRVNATRSLKVAWSIIDAQGKVVLTRNSNVAPGKNDIRLEVGQLSNGVYQLQGTTSKGMTSILRFVKAK